jgi:hypothetical protein
MFFLTKHERCSYCKNMSVTHVLTRFSSESPVMSQNLLLPKADSASMRACCLLKDVHLGFRFVRYQCFPWFVLILAPLKLLFASEVERIHEQVRYLNAIARIDFVSVYELLNDLLW